RAISRGGAEGTRSRSERRSPRDRRRRGSEGAGLRKRESSARGRVASHAHRTPHDMTDKLTHIADSGEARMVDVSAKPETKRVATATGRIRMKPETLSAIVNAEVRKGDVLAVARIAGIMAAKRTAELIPLCHPIALTDVQVALSP